MGYITISGDTDGDLHTAALHNEKFGTIVSTINGNINHDNLAYPNSDLLITISGVRPHAGANAGWVELASVTAAAPSAVTPHSANDKINLLIPSVTRIPFSGTLNGDVKLVFLKDSGFTSGVDLTFYLQRSSVVSEGTLGSATWTNISSLTSDCYHGTPFLTDSRFPSTAGQSFTANQYFRVVVQNATSGSPNFPPDLVVNLRIKSPHV